MKNTTKHFLVMSIAAGLAACGGSGGDSNMTDNQNVTGSTGSESQHAGTATGYKVNKTIVDKIEYGDISESEKVKKYFWKIGNYDLVIESEKTIVIDLSKFPDGLNTLPLTISGVSNGGDHIRSEGYAKVYQQFYTASMGINNLRSYENDKLEDESDDFEVAVIAGAPTPAAAIPSQGSVDYSGKAYNGSSQGNFAYHVNFADKTGQGSVTGLDSGTVALEKGSLTNLSNAGKSLKEDIVWTDDKAQMLFTGQARYENGAAGTYGIGVFGPHGEEVAGVVSDASNEFVIGVGGQAATAR